MSAPRFFTDEDVYSGVAAGLRKAGLDAMSTPEAGRLGESDELQLAWAAHEGRVLVTFNVAHFAELHATWIARGGHHAGVVVSGQRPLGDTLRRLLRIAAELDATSLDDRLEFLGDWPVY